MDVNNSSGFSYFSQNPTRFFQDYLCTPAPTVEMDIRRNGERKCPRGADRELPFVWIRYKLEQSHRSVSIYVFGEPV